jgi:guanylate kinase
MTQDKGPLIIVSGPSGSGKSSVIDGLLRTGGLPLRLSVSATTRGLRGEEQDDRDYHFWTRDRFELALREGAFLEHAEVYGNYYGTLRSEVEPYRDRGIGVVLDIDVQGAEQVRRVCPDAVSVFVRPPSLAVLEQRLRDRHTDTEAAIRRRLAAAERELARSGEYQYQVVNDDLDRAVAELRAIVSQHFKGEPHAG